MQVGVQCEVVPENTTAALEEKVNAVLPLQIKDEGKDDVEMKESDKMAEEKPAST